MSPLKIEGYNPQRNEWIQVGEVQTTDPKGTLSNLPEDGSRELYIFGPTPDDEKSLIQRSNLGIDREIVSPRFREVAYDPSELETLVELEEGQTYELAVKTDISPEPRHVRFTHVKE